MECLSDDELNPIELEKQREISNAAKNLMDEIKKLLDEKKLEDVAQLFRKEPGACKNLSLLKEIGIQLYFRVIVKCLTLENYEKNPPLYGLAKELLKLVANFGPVENMLMEFLDLFDKASNEHVMTAALCALQGALLRVGNKKPHAMEICLDSIVERIRDLPIPSILSEGYDDEQRNLLEQDEDVENVLTYYVTISFFYEPLVQQTAIKCRREREIFRNCGITQCNVLCCFLVQLLDKPLALLHLDGKVFDSKTNRYSMQSATDLTTAICCCIKNPYFFLTIIEQRIRYQRRLRRKNKMELDAIQNVFFDDEKLPLVGLATFYYIIIEHRMGPTDKPHVYSLEFLAESLFYLVTHLLGQNELPLRCRGLKLANKLFEQPPKQYSYDLLELKVHKNFCDRICNFITYTSSEKYRALAAPILEKYIMKFDDHGRFIVLKNILRTTQHSSLTGHFIYLYKQLLVDALKCKNVLPLTLCGKNFRYITMEYMFKLPNGIETDLIDNRVLIIAAINNLRYFSMCDKHNLTGFWDFIKDIELKFMEPLEKAINFSVAHYTAEIKRTETGLDIENAAEARKQLEVLELEVQNAVHGEQMQSTNLDIDKDQKLKHLNQCIVTFEMMRSLLSYARQSIKETKEKIEATNTTI